MPEFSRFDQRVLGAGEREAALRAFETTPSHRGRPGSYWKIDLDALDFTGLDTDPGTGDVTISPVSGRGVIAVDLVTAARDHRDLFARAFGVALGAMPDKFAFLTRAFAQVGAFVYIPDGVSVDDPIAITYRTTSARFFPYTLVLAGAGARATVVERLTSDVPDTMIGSIAEIVTESGASVHFASVQDLRDDARVFATRVAAPGRDAHVSWATAELGAALCVTSNDVRFDHAGADAHIATLFFPTGSQHVDVVTNIQHNVGNSTSQTVAKTAAGDLGQGRFLGNIRIAAGAQHSNASLRDDALLLSKHAHIDSIPALEIAANDVRAFHGATVGAIDDEQLFYMTSRGITRDDAERMIALGFFEPAIEHFPTEALREQIRTVLAAKVA